jgi:small subunit ribosomal protein S18
MTDKKIPYIDYKDTELLKKFLTPHARIVSRRRTTLSAKDQRAVALAIKRARFMGLLPYVAG